MNNSWFRIHKPKPTAKYRLFCFPYAGGDSNIFRTWPESTQEDVELVCLQMSGRSDRMTEPAIRTMNELVNIILPKLVPFFDKPFAFCGHSMGARLAFELTHTLIKRDLNLPSALIFSGSKAPDKPRSETKIFDMTDDQFIEELRASGGTPDLVLQNQELMEMFLPMLRADYEIVDGYAPSHTHLLNIPTVVLNSPDDYLCAGKQQEYWQKHFENKIDYILMSGGHFFINDSRNEFLSHLWNFLSYQNKLCIQSTMKYREMG